MSSENRRKLGCFPMVVIAILAILVLIGASIESKGLQAVSWVDSVLTKCERASTNKTKSSSPPPPFQMVVALLNNNGQNWKQDIGDTGEFMLDKLVKDVPIEIMSMDRLYDPKNQSNTLFWPEQVYASLVANRTGKVTFVPVLNGRTAQECPAYLTYILRHYDNLPDVSIFLHAKPQRHNGKILQDIRYVVDHWKPQEIGFLHLNRYSICRPVDPDSDWNTAWKLLGFSPQHIPPFIKGECCAQFMVTRERILLRPRWFYEQLLKYTYERQLCAFQEHFWHIFFGEHPFLPEERTIAYYNDHKKDHKEPPQKAILKQPYPNVPYSESMAVWYDKSMADRTYYDSLTNSKC